MADAIVQEVLRHRLDTIADEMEATLLRAAYSPIVKEGLDASAAIFDREGRNIAQAAAIPIHLGCLVPAVSEIVRIYPVPQMQEGDIYILNDPYHGGTHLPDIVLVMPVFVGGEVVALTTTMCHHQEIGGMVPGSLPPNATEIFQEGLIIPPLKLYDRGEQVPPVFALLRANVRIPDVVLGDLRAQISACHVGARGLREVFGEFGPDTVQDVITTLIERSEQLTRERLRAIPDGTYRFTDYLDDDGVDFGKPIPIRASVTIRDASVHIDFTGTAPQLRGPFNCVYSSTLSAVYYVIRAVTGSDIPNNHGCYVPISLHLPEGSLVNPRMPAPVNSRTASVRRLTDVLLGCFAQAVPERLSAASCGQLLVMNFGGTDPETGRAFITSELGAGGMGGRPGKDGIDCIETDTTNCMNIPAEALEMESPIRVLRSRIWQDSGGAGRWRGGCGLEKVFEVTRGEATATYRGERHTSQPWGVAGGGPAARSMAYILRASGEHEDLQSKAVLHLGKGDRLHVFIGGGGGYGEPMDRPADLVARDVANGYISANFARERYGVALDAAGHPDAESTARNREGRTAPAQISTGGGGK